MFASLIQRVNDRSRPRTSRGLAVATLVAAMASTYHAAALGGETTAPRPNIVLIVADDLGYGDLGFQGGQDVPTPNLDGLAASGVQLTNGYVSCPVCSPTRAGLATGRYQQRFGHEFNPGQAKPNADVTVGLPLTEKTLASALHDAGYTTANVGKWHLGAADGYRPLQRGFDEFYGFLGGAHPYVKGGAGGQGAQGGQGGRRARRAQQNAGQGGATAVAGDPNAGGANQPIFRGEEQVEFPEHLTSAFGNEAAAFINRQKGSDKPFYLYLTFNAVHNPLQPDPEHAAKFENIQDPKRRAYAGLLSGLDDAVGVTLQSLRDSGQLENTIVFFISDNGGPQQGNGSNNKPLTGDKGTVKEGGIRVPYLVSWKGKLQPGAKFDQPAISLDITATAAALGGATLGGEGRPVDGVNLIPYLTGEVKTAPHEALYWRFGPQHAIRSGDYKLLQQQGDAEPRLYNVVADVAEAKDISAEHPEVVRDLNERYAAWDAELAEPLWKKGQPRNGRRARQRAANAAAAAEPAATKPAAPAAS